MKFPVIPHITGFSCRRSALPHEHPGMTRTMVGLSLLVALHGFALELEMPAVFADHMVLQREQTVPIWGTADTDATITVEFAGQTTRAEVDDAGHWRVDLNAMAASAESRDLVVSAKDSEGKAELRFTDVLVGEVWLCGGQSNMYRPFRMLTDPAVDPFYEPAAIYLREEAARGNDPLFRQYRVGPDISPLKEHSTGRGNWSMAVPGEINEFSGTGYFFGRELRRELKVPVALLSCNLGGTRIEPWIPPQSFENNDSLKSYYDRELKTHKKRITEWDETKEKASYTRALNKWKAAKVKGGKPSKQPRKPEPPSRDKQVPGGLYNGMVNPLVPFAIKGAIWYQGESNSSHHPEAYGERLTTLIDGWRNAWGQKKFHFFWCQLANYKAANTTPVGDDDGWALVQNGQREALKSPDTGMAVLHDIGEPRDVHPKNKLDAGKRLSLWALSQAYGKNLVYSGPLFKKAELKEHKVMITFDHVGSGLMVGQKKLMDPTTEVEEPLKRFQIRGADQKWQWADAKIVSADTVAVWHNEIPQPIEVRYAWSSNPEGANLYNREGLPASLFKTTPTP